MLGIFKKHPKLLWGIIIAIVVVTLLGVWQRRQYMKNPYEKQIGNPPRETGEVSDNFYYNQLTDKEKEAYNTLKNAIENYQGGEVVFPEPLNGKEYARVSQTLQCGEDDYFYAMADVPMNEKNQNVTYKTSNLLDITQETITKCMLFLYPAEGIDTNGKIDEDGYVTNLNELGGSLANMQKEKKDKVERIKKETNNILNKVVENLPEEYGKKEAIDYFLDWMDKNLKIDEEIMQSTEGIKNMTQAFEKVYFESYLSCVTLKKANTTGYAKVLTYLCNKAGIPAHIVMGSWNSTESYVFVYTDFDGKDVFIDASGYRKKDLWDQRYISETLLERKMDLIDYFNYGGKEES